MNTQLLVQQPREALLSSWGGEVPPPDAQDYLGRAWRALKGYRWMVAGIVAIGTLLAVGSVLLTSPTYSATSEVMIDGRRAQVLRVGTNAPDLPIDLDTVSNEIQVIQSRDLVGSVVQQLDLEHNPDFNPNRTGFLRRVALSSLDAVRPWLSETAFAKAHDAIKPPVLQGREYTDAIIDAVERSLDVSSIGRSRAISITFTSSDPLMAQKFANAIAQRYVDHQTEMKQGATEDANRQITNRLAGLQKTAADAASKVEQYRAKLGLTEGRDSTLIRQQISETSSQLTVAQRDRLAAASRLSDIKRAAAAGGDGNEEILSSQLIQQLRVQQAQIARETSSSGIIYGEKHPTAEVSRAQSASIQRRIDQETAKIVAAVRGDYQAALDRENGLRARLDQLMTEMGKVRENEVSLDQLAQNATAAKDIYEAFLRRAHETDVGSALQSPDAYIIAHAPTPVSPVSPRPKIVIPVGMAMSGIFAIVAVLALDARDRGFQSQAQVSRELNLPTLGMIPELRRTRAPDPLSLIGTAITDLYLQIVLGQERTGCILITSAVPREGKTSVGLTLARIAARNGKRTLFVDADMRRSPRLRRPFDASHAGLSEVLTGHAQLDEVVFADKVAPGVSVLACGAATENPSGLICSAAMRDLLRNARGDYDLIFIDAPPVMVGPEAWMLALFADTTLLFVRWARTPRKIVAAAYDKLARTGAKISGVVLTMVDVDQMARNNPTDGASYSKEVRRYYGRRAA